ncbi:MAG: hypothetical protein HGA80_07965 [Candidatus Omnitrophica bacterium]|nr:hypothetical protein [Candidatus Omnitrophota bacterium]
MMEHIEKIVSSDRRYGPGAYAFVMEALSYTQKRFRRERHVTGEELLVGVGELAVRQFGPLALPVFQRWGMRSSEDVGYVVFNLVEHGVLGKQEEDTFDSFRNGRDLEAVFSEEYRKQLAKVTRRLR